jgi:hypothetical protein
MKFVILWVFLGLSDRRTEFGAPDPDQILSLSSERIKIVGARRFGAAVIPSEDNASFKKLRASEVGGRPRSSRGAASVYGSNEIQRFKLISSVRIGEIAASSRLRATAQTDEDQSIESSHINPAAVAVVKRVSPSAVTLGLDPIAGDSVSRPRREADRQVVLSRGRRV